MKQKTILKQGNKINRLTVLEFSHIGNHNRKYFKFKCDCGKEKIILGSLVVSGNTKSCGCLSIEVKKSKLLPNNMGVIRQIILGYKRHAKDRGFCFNLSESQVIKLISEKCYYCGLPPSNKKTTKNHTGLFYSGIDRVDSDKDYDIDNCVSCCEQCNKAKRDISIEQFKDWIERLHKAMAEQWSKFI
jgi:hypothetical protein